MYRDRMTMGAGMVPAMPRPGSAPAPKPASRPALKPALKPAQKMAADLVLIQLPQPGCTAAFRDALRELPGLREIVVIGCLCRARTDPGAAGTLVAALRALGHDLALVVLTPEQARRDQWRDQWQQ